MFDSLPCSERYGAVLADPPWNYEMKHVKGTVERHYQPMSITEIRALPIKDYVLDDSVLFLWVCWPLLPEGLSVINAWGFTYKTCAFSWVKADNRQPDFFQEEVTPYMGIGYWTRANSEACLLATRGHPKRLNADVRQAIIAPRREHSRKPDGVHERIERLVSGPYLELFARQKRAGWDVWGNQTERFAPKVS